MEVVITAVVGAVIKKEQLISKAPEPKLKECCLNSRYARVTPPTAYCSVCGSYLHQGIRDSYALTDLGVRLGIPEKDCEWGDLEYSNNSTMDIVEWDDGRILCSETPKQAWVFGKKLWKINAMQNFSFTGSNTDPVSETELTNICNIVRKQFSQCSLDPNELGGVALYTQIYVG